MATSATNPRSVSWALRLLICLAAPAPLYIFVAMNALM